MITNSSKDNKEQQKYFAELTEEVLELKKKKRAVMLVHNYQRLEVQAIADLMGDSLGLSRAAKDVKNAKMIVFAGVLFMAETAKILNPGMKVLIPDLKAGCPLADQCSPEIVNESRKKYGEDIPVVLYVNTTAEAKAVADLTCTSSNAVEVVRKLNVKRVLFGPDHNLAQFVQERLPEVEVISIPEDGHCIVHKRFDVESLKKLKEQYPAAVIYAHPECDIEVQHMADFVGSTSGMYRLGMETDADTIILATEKGLVDRLNNERPEKTFLVAKETGICRNMKKITLEKVRDSLLKEQFEVIVPEEIRVKAERAILRMLELS